LQLEQLHTSSEQKRVLASTSEENECPGKHRVSRPFFTSGTADSLTTQYSGKESERLMHNKP
jgi:hypothetical protein